MSIFLSITIDIFIITLFIFFIFYFNTQCLNRENNSFGIRDWTENRLRPHEHAAYLNKTHILILWMLNKKMMHRRRLIASQQQQQQQQQQHQQLHSLNSSNQNDNGNDYIGIAADGVGIGNDERTTAADTTTPDAGGEGRTMTTTTAAALLRGGDPSQGRGGRCKPPPPPSAVSQPTPRLGMKTVVRRHTSSSASRQAGGGAPRKAAAAAATTMTTRTACWFLGGATAFCLMQVGTFLVLDAISSQQSGGRTVVRPGRRGWDGNGNRNGRPRRDNDGITVAGGNTTTGVGADSGDNGRSHSDMDDQDNGGGGDDDDEAAALSPPPVFAATAGILHALYEWLTSIGMWGTTGQSDRRRRHRWTKDRLLQERFDRQDASPILIVGGSDGSGTRAFVDVLRELGGLVVADDPETFDVHAAEMFSHTGWPGLVNAVLNVTHGADYDWADLTRATVTVPTTRGTKDHPPPTQQQQPLSAVVEQEVRGLMQSLQIKYEMAKRSYRQEYIRRIELDRERLDRPSQRRRRRRRLLQEPHHVGGGGGLKRLRRKGGPKKKATTNGWNSSAGGRPTTFPALAQKVSFVIKAPVSMLVLPVLARLAHPGPIKFLHVLRE
jgi:hypothetical protein